MNKQKIKSIAKKSGILSLYSKYRRWYDNTHCDRFECGIGDILLLRDVPSNNQLLLTSRLMDVEDYLSGKDKTFPWQNTISRKAYGDKHREEDGNRSFKALIESYLKDGYHPDSIITCDNDMNLMDGNHRMGLHIHEGIERVNVRRVHRKVPFQYGGDWYFENGLSATFMDCIYERYDAVQKWLIESGNTFCVYAEGSDAEVKEVESVLKHLCTVLCIKSVAGGVILQFSMPSPEYSFKDNKLVSKRAEQIESILRKRFTSVQLKLEVAKNCLEGKVCFEKYQKQY